MDVQKSLCIAFLTISDKYHNFDFCEICSLKWLLAAILDVRKSLSISFQIISGHFRSIRNFFLGEILQNGCRRPFWVSEIHFRLHFWPFQIDRPFWMSEIHLRSQIWPFQGFRSIQNSLLMAFLPISDPYGT